MLYTVWDYWQDGDFMICIIEKDDILYYSEAPISELRGEEEEENDG